jgi:hypothetical protein
VGKLADDAALAVEPLSKLAKEHGAVFYRFRVTHLAQPKAGDTPVFLSRCGKIVAASQIDEPALRRWADKLAGSLLSHGWADAGSYGMAGTLNPLLGTYGPRFAGPLEQGLIARALMRYRSVVGRPGKLEHVEPDIRQWLENGARALAVREPDETDPAASPVSAALVHAWLDYLPVEPLPPTYAGSLQAIQEPELVALKKRCLDTVEGAVRGGGNLPDAELALVLCLDPAVRHNVADNDGPLTDIYKRLGSARVVSAMPWLGWADLRLHPKGDLRTAVALRDMREQIWKHQLRAADLPADQQDLVGGIAFTTSKNPMPTWQMARPLAFVATMLGDPRLTEEKEWPEELSRLLVSLRFLRQLTAGEAEGFMYKNPEKAMWGVRSSLWDQRMPPEATAMTLMTVCETLRSLEEIKKRREQK